MTPQRYQEIRREQELIIEAAHKKIAEARNEAESCPMPENLRPATAADVVLGAVIWKPEWDGVRKWSIVEGIYDPNDDWKAWDDDGCRYGLHAAFVENADVMASLPRASTEAPTTH